MRLAHHAARLAITLTFAAIAPKADAQRIAFTADQTPPSASTTGPQVTFGPVSSAVNLGSVSVCPYNQPLTASCTEQQTLLYTVTQGGTFAAPTALTEGLPNLDFRLVSTTCSGALVTNAQCTVTFTFNPLQAGLRRGAITFPGTGATPIATTFLYGIGAGPSDAFNPAPQSNISSVGNASGVAVNAQGDVFFLDGAGVLYKIPVNSRGTQIQLDAGFSSAGSIALDGAGNIYVADTGHKIVLKVPPAGGPGVPIGQSLNTPSGVAVDGLGNVFVSDSAANQVIEVPINGGPQITVGSGYSDPTGLAVDLAGNLYVADTGNARVLKVPPNGGAQTTLGSGFRAPLAVAVDAAGNVFVGDQGALSVTEIPADSSLPFPIGNNLNFVSALALAADGDLYIADKSQASIIVLQRSAQPNFVFADTAVGSISSDSPAFVRVQNIGTAPLFIGPSPTTVDPDFVLVHGPSFAPYCTNGVSVAPGSECILQFSFQPQSTGTFSSDYVLNSNNLNTTFNQSIALKGTGTGTTTRITLNGPGSAYYGSQVKFLALSNSPAPITYAVVSGPATIDSTGLLTVTGIGAITISASQAATGNYTAGSVTFTFGGVIAGTFTTLTATPVSSGFGTAARLVATVHPDTSGVPTGTVRFIDGTTELARVTLTNGVATFTTGQLTGGTHQFAAVYLGSNFFDVSLGSATLTVPSTQVTLKVLDPTVRYPIPVIIRVRVQRSGQPEPHGKITILDGSTPIANFRMPAAADGNLLELILPPLKPGAHVLTAVYAGDAKYPPGVSDPVTVTVKK